MATIVQITAVQNLHNVNERVEITTAYPFEEDGAVVSGKTTYDIASQVTKTMEDDGITEKLAFGDPYETYYAGKVDSNG